jgi:hypothetical protein
MPDDALSFGMNFHVWRSTSVKPLETCKGSDSSTSPAVYHISLQFQYVCTVDWTCTQSQVSSIICVKRVIFQEWRRVPRLMVGVLNVDSLSIPIGGCLLNIPSEHMDNHKRSFQRGKYGYRCSNIYIRRPSRVLKCSPACTAG